MLVNDARILTRSAIATAIAGVILVVIGAVLGGGKGAVGAALGVVLVAAFFTVSVVAVSLAGRLGPPAMMAAALGTYLVKILVLVFVMVRLADTTAFNTRIFGITVVICVLVWSAGQIATLTRRKMLYVDPEALDASVVPTRRASTVPEARQSSTVPEARQSSTVPEARQSSTVPEARQTSASGER